MKRLWLVFILFGCAMVCSGEEYKDTLWTTDHDRIIITYDLQYNNEGVDIRFLNVKKNLGRINGQRYKKLENVEIVFFDRTGVYSDMTFTNMTPEAFMVPSNLKYSKSDLGYFFLQNRPLLSFKIMRGEDFVISIPLYLAYYQGKTERKLFSVCKRFDVALKGFKYSEGSTSDNGSVKKNIHMPEVEKDNETAAEVAIQINIVMDLLETQTKLPFTDGLQYEITCLRNLQKVVKDKSLLSKIKECLTECELKKIELEERASAAAKRAQMEAENAARLTREREQARQDSIAVVQQEQAAAEKKRNLWMIIGGIILAAIASVANQLFQHFRHIRNQKSMMEMQQNIAIQAEYEAKRQAQSYARRKTHEVVNKARNNMQSGNNKSNKFSI